MKSLIAAVLFTVNSIAYADLPPFIDLTEEQAARLEGYMWIIGNNNKPQYSKEQAEFYEIHRQEGIISSLPSSNISEDKITLYSDQYAPLIDLLNTIAMSLGYTTSTSGVKDPEVLSKEISLVTKDTPLIDVLNYIEYVSGLKISIYPREAGGLLEIRND